MKSAAAFKHPTCFLFRFFVLQKQVVQSLHNFVFWSKGRKVQTDESMLSSDRFSDLTRTFGTAPVREPSQRRSGTSSSHGERRAAGTGAGFWSGRTGGAGRLPDPPALCAGGSPTRPVLRRGAGAVRIQNRRPRMTSERLCRRDGFYSESETRFSA